MPPFSEERSRLLNEGYYLVTTVLEWYQPEWFAPSLTSSKSIDFVCSFLAKQSGTITLYEAGVGKGLSCRSFLKYHNVRIMGCDVVLYDSVKELMQQFPDRISVDENTFYDSLQNLPDESIDIFYADNVFEHMFPDEFPAIMSLLTRNLKHGALLFLFIPNSINGPHDVSTYFTKMGSKAYGFHFMEQTYHEVTESYKQYGLVPAYFTYRTIFKNYRCIPDFSGRLNKLKLGLENLAKLIPGRWFRGKFMALAGLSTYIMRKD